VAWYRPWEWGRKNWEQRGRGYHRPEVIDIIVNHVGPNVPIKLRDGSLPFRALSNEDFRAVIAYSRNPDPAYQSEIFDCDDSGDTFMGDMKRGWEKLSKGREALLMGWIHLHLEKSENAHWINWMINCVGQFTLIEPQRNKIVGPRVESIFEVTQ